MADAAASPDAGSSNDDTEGAPPPPAKRGRGKLLIILGAALVLVLGGSAGAYFSGLLDPFLGAASEKEGAAEGKQAVAEEAPEPVYYDLPEFIVNLNTEGRKSTFLKLRARIELRDADDIARIEKRMPVIVDTFQVYLRELHRDEIEGSAGTYRLREALLRRIRQTVAPATVAALLFTDVLVQ